MGLSNGIGRYAVDKARDYAAERKVWSTPIGAHQGIAHPLAEAHIGVELARLATARSAEMFDAGENAATAVNIAKFTAADASLKALDQAIQTHGGNGLSREYGLADLWFVARMLRTAPVSREMVLNPPRASPSPASRPSRTSPIAGPTSRTWTPPPSVPTRWTESPDRRHHREILRRPRRRRRRGRPVRRGPPDPSRLPHPRGGTPRPRGRPGVDARDRRFQVNNGAIVIEVGGITQETFEEVGAKFDVRRANPPILYRIGGKNADITGGGWGLLMSKLTRHGAKPLSGIGATREDSGLPDTELSTADWIRHYTKNESVHGVFRNMCGSVFAVGSERPLYVVPMATSVYVPSSAKNSRRLSVSDVQARE